MGMQSGKLWQEIEVQQRDQTINGIGESVANWVTYSFKYCEINFLSGSETMIQDQVNSLLTSEITIRFDGGMRSTMRIVYKGRFYNIDDINNVDERDKKMILSCTRQESKANG